MTDYAGLIARLTEIERRHERRHWAHSEDCKALAFKIESLQAELAEARGYMQHPRTCTNYGDPNECTCGLDAFLAKHKDQL